MNLPKIDYRKHNECFEEAQAVYLSKPFGSRAVADYRKMYLIAYDYFHNALIRYSVKHCIYWQRDRIDELAADCTNWICEMYLRRPHFAIQKLTSYGHFSLLKNIARDKNWERNVTLNADIGENENYDN